MSDPTQTDTEAATICGKHLTFSLGSESYGMPILTVKEIVGMLDVTPVPRTPPHVRGVINLRGKIVAVVDLRARLGMEEVERTDETCIIVVRTRGIEMGIIVDTVSEVQDIPEDAIVPAPSFGTGVRTDYLRGVGRVDGNVQLLIDIDRIVSPADADVVHDASSDD